MIRCIAPLILALSILVKCHGELRLMYNSIKAQKPFFQGNKISVLDVWRRSVQHSMLKGIALCCREVTDESWRS